jgi:PAS domain S-box-containing protein
MGLPALGGWARAEGGLQRLMLATVGSTAFPAGGGEMGALIRAFDWARTPLGAIPYWPQSLRTAVDIVLRSPVPLVMLWGQDGIMIYNDAYSEFAGGRHPQLLGSKVLEGWPEVADLNRRVMEAGLSGKTLSFRDEHLILYRPGRPRDVWVNLDYSPLLDESGAPAGVLAIVVETTERVRAEKALRDSEAQFRTFAAAMPHHVWAATPDGKLDWINQQVADYSGADGADLMGDRWGDLVHPDDINRAVAAWRKALETATVYEIEFRLRRSDGAYRWHLTRATPIRDEAGQVVRWIGTNTDIDDRIRAERTLREREADLARVQQIGKVGGVEVDLTEGFRNRRSPEYLVIHGLPPEAARESHEDWVRRIHPEDRERTEQQFIEAVNGGVRDYVTEYRIIRPSDGQLRWIAVKAEIERNSEGRAVRLVGAHIDVTDSKTAELAHRESEERFRLVSESAPVMLWMGDSNGRCLYLNRTQREFWGVALADVADFDWNSSLHPDDRETLYAPFAQAMRDHTSFVVEARYRRVDGEYRLLRTDARPRFGPLGDFVGMIGVNVDITETRRAEQALRGLNETLEAQVEARTRERDRIWNVSQDILIVADQQGNWINVNPAATAMLGWSQTELLGRPAEWLAHPDDIVRTRDETAHLAAGGVTQRFENRLRHKDGSYRWLSWTAAAFEGLIYAAARDVTEEKEAAQTLQRTEEALRQSQKMEAVGQLTGGIAHDFNNLLQGIVGSLDLVQKRLADGRLSEIQRYVSGAMTSANRAAALTHRLLAFSRRQPLDPKPLRANPLITSMEDLLRRTMGERVQLELALAGDLWPTLCDHNQLENSILNLAINARDAMPDGGRLRIETRNARLDDTDLANQRDVPAGDYVCVSVTDTGTGMTAAVMERAFDPFFTTKPIGQGTGLGLSMIYGFARQSDGCVKIASQPGMGTTVSLYLPRRHAEEEIQVTSEQPPEHLPGSGQTVLVVEDEPLVRLLIIDVLDELGYKALEASDGPSGLRILQSPQRVDLLITDIGLPGLNGRQVADAARVVRPDLKVLFMTGYAENAAAAQGILASGMQIITKPFAMDVLAKRIRELMDAR